MFSPDFVVDEESIFQLKASLCRRFNLPKDTTIKQLYDMTIDNP